MLKISILVDNPDSWFIPYAKKLEFSLKVMGYDSSVYNEKSLIPASDICFMLSCTKIVNRSFLDKNKHNIVVHASDLPKGKGFTPLKWQILEGNNIIPLTLFEAVEDCDAGPYYFKDSVSFEGHEFIEEMQMVMANKIIEMCERFAKQYGKLIPIEQEGESTYYNRLKKEDDVLNVDQTIKDVFNKFRITDFKRYPLTFKFLNHKYSIKIEQLD